MMTSSRPAPRTFRALRHRNYRLFFTGQLISLTGTWMQNTAQSWLVYELTGSKFLLGAVAALGSLPMLLFSTFGGALADRFPKRRILMFTQTTAMSLAFIMSALIYSGRIEVWHIALVAGLLGAVMAFDMPSRQAFVVEMVGKDDLMNAIALNSSLFNSARIVGPAIAGLVMAHVNIALCYLLNALSFTAVLAGLKMMQLPPVTLEPQAEPVWKHALGGLNYVSHHKPVRTLLLLIGVAGVFGWSYSVLMPAFARDVLGVQESGYGTLIAASGLGALLGALSLATFGDHVPRRLLILGGLLWFSVMIMCFAFSRYYPLSLLFLAAAGFGIIVFMSTCNTTLQTSVPDEYRGRVMGVWALVFAGTMPAGSFQAGTMAHYIGPSWTVALGATVCALSAGLVWWRVRARAGGKGPINAETIAGQD